MISVSESLAIIDERVRIIDTVSKPLDQAVGLCLAELIGGEIISLDSMQLWRGMDVGTAKPPPERKHDPVRTSKTLEKDDGPARGSAIQNRRRRSGHDEIGSVVRKASKHPGRSSVCIAP